MATPQDKINVLKQAHDILTQVFNILSPTVSVENDLIFKLWSQSNMSAGSLKRSLEILSENPKVADLVLASVTMSDKVKESTTTKTFKELMSRKEVAHFATAKDGSDVHDMTLTRSEEAIQLAQETIFSEMPDFTKLWFPSTDTDWACCANLSSQTGYFIELDLLEDLDIMRAYRKDPKEAFKIIAGICQELQKLVESMDKTKTNDQVYSYKLKCLSVPIQFGFKNNNLFIFGPRASLKASQLS